MGLCNGNFYFPLFNLHYKDYAIPTIRANSQKAYFQHQNASWNNHFSPKFSEIRMQSGIGFAFNLIDSSKLLRHSEIDEELRYERNITLLNRKNLFEISPHDYPLTVSKNDLMIFELKIQKPEIPDKNSIKCKSHSILVGPSDELQTFKSDYMSKELKYGMLVNVEVIPEIIQTDKELKKLKPHQRECYFDGEKKLKFFKIYSEKNCQIECSTNKTLLECGCVENMDPYDSRKGTKICAHNILEDPCNFWMTPNYFEEECHCWPPCHSVSYHLKYSTETLSDNDNMSIIRVQMNFDDMILFRRYQQFNFSDVVSYVGGLLGLFAGISMLSIVEFFYFFTLRLFTDVMRWILKRRRILAQTIQAW
jgi:amiloride-sensitive sodium channel